MRLVVDSREGLPYTFQGPHFRGVEVVPGTLKTGDYSIEGFEPGCDGDGNGGISVERKNPQDFIACMMGENRSRFKRELARAMGYESKDDGKTWEFNEDNPRLDAFAVFVECSWEYLCKHWYESKIKPRAVIMSALSMAQEFNVGFFFCGTRAATEFAVYGYLKQFWNDREAERKAREKV